VLDDRVSALWKERTSLMQQIKVRHARLVILRHPWQPAAWHISEGRVTTSKCFTLQKVMSRMLCHEVQGQLLEKLMQSGQETSRQLAALRATVDQSMQAAPAAKRDGATEASTMIAAHIAVLSIGMHHHVCLQTHGSISRMALVVGACTPDKASSSVQQRQPMTGSLACRSHMTIKTQASRA
jgi:hypothetical protein